MQHVLAELRLLVQQVAEDQSRKQPYVARGGAGPGCGVHGLVQRGGLVHNAGSGNRPELHPPAGRRDVRRRQRAALDHDQVCCRITLARYDLPSDEPSPQHDPGQIFDA